MRLAEGIYLQLAEILRGSCQENPFV